MLVCEVNAIHQTGRFPTVVGCHGFFKVLFNVGLLYSSCFGPRETLSLKWQCIKLNIESVYCCILHLQVLLAYQGCLEPRFEGTKKAVFKDISVHSMAAG